MLKEKEEKKEKVLLSPTYQQTQAPRDSGSKFLKKQPFPPYPPIVTIKKKIACHQLTLSQAGELISAVTAPHRWPGNQTLNHIGFHRSRSAS